MTTKKLACIALSALLPALAAAAAPQPDGSRPDEGRRGHIEKRLRVARAVGLAEALDLDEAGALRVRDILAKYDDQRAPLREQLRGGIKTVRDAAHGDPAAAAQVDAALQRTRDARAKLQQLDAKMLDEIAKGFTPERKARAAVFLATFRHRAAGMGMHHGGPRGECGPGRHPGMGGHGPMHGTADAPDEPAEG
jgi:Spy/CpxP family protein refolding chaperone